VPPPEDEPVPDDGRGLAGDGLTRDFGPRPPRPETSPGRGRWKTPAAAFVLVAAFVALGVTRLATGDGDDDTGGDGCPEVDDPVSADGGQLVSGDPEGDGCTTVGTYGFSPDVQRMVLAIRLGDSDKRIALGDPGDTLLLGDWNCDGVDTPGLYRATAGSVQYFDGWPDVEQQQYPPDLTEPAAPGGVASLQEGDPDADGRARCDHVAIAPPAPPAPPPTGPGTPGGDVPTPSTAPA
jgi:hypothetical protein